MRCVVSGLDEIHDLLVSIQKAEDKPFETLLDAYRPLIKKEVSLYTGKYGLTSADSEDLSQEAMIALYLAALTYSDSRGASFGTYAAACIRNRIISYIRPLISTVRTVPLDIGDDVVSDESPEQTVLEREAQKNLFDRISTILTPLEKSVLNLFLETRNYQEIADKLSVSRKSVDNAMCRIRAKLRKIVLSH